MKPSFTPSQISYSDFTDSVADHPRHVPEKAQPLEPLRYHDIPSAVARRKTAGAAFLEKPELQSLVEWKLKSGTFRPTLAKLVASNPATEIQTTTSSAFSIFASTSPSNPSKALSALCTLRGIGPATASLILSCYDPVTVPFFSDELFRWLHWEGEEEKEEEEEDMQDDKRDDGGSKKKKKKRRRGKKNGSGVGGGGLERQGGWGRKIKYTAREYLSLWEKTVALRERLAEESGGKSIGAVDVEKAAFAIAKRDALGILAEGRKEEGCVSADGGDGEEGNVALRNSTLEERDESLLQRERRSKRRKVG
ncbi:MAG: hypothetical protein Q9216_003679 [Gyalolechia sp. 2 TL-2023]